MTSVEEAYKQIVKPTPRQQAYYDAYLKLSDFDRMMITGQIKRVLRDGALRNVSTFSVLELIGAVSAHTVDPVAFRKYTRF